MKLLLWLVLAWLAAMWFLHQKKLKAKRAAERMASPRENPPASTPPQVGEAMLPCAHCGLFLPRSEAITSANSGLVWCCEEHRLRHPG
jgi:uncharacterized protein